MFADEHMVEMNRRTGLPRRRWRSRTPTPRPLKNPSPAPQPHTPTEDTPTIPETTNHCDSSEKNGSVEPPPFLSSSLPDDASEKAVNDNKTTGLKAVVVDKLPVDKLTNNSRKRERTPSPTYMANKRPALANSGLTKFTSSALPGSKITGGGLKGSASKVLTEEIQKQQGAENSRLKVLIVKEVRKPGKSKYLCVVCDYCYIGCLQTMRSSFNTSKL